MTGIKDLNALRYINTAKVSYISVWKSMVSGNIWWWLIFHIVLGILSAFTKILLILWFYFLILNYILNPRSKRLFSLPLALGYLIPLELLGRIVYTPPYIPFEVGKYLGAILLFYGIYTNKDNSRGSDGKWILALSLPAVIVGYLDSNVTYQNIISHYAGLFNLSLAVIYFANKSLSRKQILDTFKVIILISISVLSYTIFGSPNFEEATFTLSSNASFSGGGKNQTSTIFGMAFGIAFWFWIIRYKLFSQNWLNLFVPALFFLWALLTFSRGGVLAAAGALILTIILVPGDNKPLNPRKVGLPLIITTTILLGGGFWYINEISDNQLLLRYQGETQGSLIGMKEVDANLMTSGRWEMLLKDIEVFLDHPFGVGVARSAYVRMDYGYDYYIAAHVEVSRLLSEHGIFGFIITLILFISPVRLYFNATGNKFRQSLIIFCMALALLTSFHAAMRTFLTPFFYGLAYVTIKMPVHRNTRITKTKQHVLEKS